MLAFPDFKAAAKALQNLRVTQSVLVADLCQEHRTVLQAGGASVQPSPYGWVVRRL